MLARADSSPIRSCFRRPRPRRFPAWARAENPPETEAEAAFLAGAALARLDAIARENRPWAGVWRQSPGARRRRRQRLTYRPRRRRGGAARRVPSAPGRATILDPAGRRLLAWRALTARSAGLWPQSVEAAAEVLGVKRDEALQDVDRSR